MATVTIWTKSYWLTVLERVLRGAAIGALLVLGDSVLTGSLNAFDIDWATLGGYALGGALLALIFSIAGNAVSKNGPAFISHEQVKPELPAPADS